MFKVELSSSAARFLKKCEKDVAKRIVERIEKLAQDPFPADAKRVVNRTEKVFRVRVGDYRIQYTLIYEQDLLFITNIDKRERAYD